MGLQDARGFQQAFQDSQLQINWQSATLELTESGGGTASYPLLYPQPTSAPSILKVQADMILMGVFWSTTWLQNNATESAAVALAPSSANPISCLGLNASIFGHSFHCWAGAAVTVPIVRNPGLMLPPPLQKFVPKATNLQVFGSTQNQLKYRTTCQVYYLSLPDYQKYMNWLG